MLEGAIEYFEARVKRLTEKLMKQHFLFPKLQKTYNKFVLKYIPLLNKYGTKLQTNLAKILDIKNILY